MCQHPASSPLETAPEFLHCHSSATPTATLYSTRQAPGQPRTKQALCLFLERASTQAFLVNAQGHSWTWGTLIWVPRIFLSDGCSGQEKGCLYGEVESSQTREQFGWGGCETSIIL